MIFFKRGKDNFINKLIWQVDKTMLLSIFLLFFIGIILVISVSPFVAIRIGINPLYFIKNHFIYMFLAIPVMLALATLQKKQIIFISVAIMLGSIFFMLLIIILGIEIKGAKRWVYIFGISLQPSEFAKVVFPVCIALIWKYLTDLGRDKTFVYTVLFILWLGFVTLLLLQPDVGMTILTTAVFVSLMVLTNIPILAVLILACVIIFFFVLAYFTFPHVSYRINSFLFSGEESYQVNKALSSISSGKIFGKGAGQGDFKEYLPDAHTDFIFTVGAEEFGLLFSIFIMVLYALILYRAYLSIKKQTDIFYILSISGLSLVLAFQVIIHIASNINLIPTKGMTLPLISYGGSSLLSTAILLGILLGLTKKDVQKIILKVK